MREPVINLVHSLDVKPVIKYFPTAWAPPMTCYFLNEKENSLDYFKSLYSAEKEKNDWIRKYENALKGLTYWRDRALH